MHLRGVVSNHSLSLRWKWPVQKEQAIFLSAPGIVASRFMGGRRCRLVTAPGRMVPARGRWCHVAPRGRRHVMWPGWRRRIADSDVDVDVCPADCRR